MRPYCLLFLLVVAGGQASCATPSITMRHPVNGKVVQCVNEPCAAQYEAVGYARLTDAQKAQLGLK